MEFIELKNLLTISKGKQLNREVIFKVETHDLYPVINGGIVPSGYWNKFNQNESQITISQGGASAGFVQWINTKFWAGAHCYLISIQSKNLLIKYLYFFLKGQEAKLMSLSYGGGIPALATSSIYNLAIPLPSLNQQQKIAHLLTNFENAIKQLLPLLEREKEFRIRQMVFYKNYLLESLKKYQTEKLNVLCSWFIGRDKPKENFSKTKTDFFNIPIYSNGTTEKTMLCGYTDKANVKKECISVAVAGEKSGFVKWQKNPFFAIGRINCITPLNKKISVPFLKHYVDWYIKNNVIKYGAIPRVSTDFLKDVNLPVIEIERQKIIGNILEEQELKIFKINELISKEIELRKQQFQYYLNQIFLHLK